jgi:hypothetical protein
VQRIFGGGHSGLNSKTSTDRYSPMADIQPLWHLTREGGRKMAAEFQKLLEYLSRVPSVLTNNTSARGIGCGEDSGFWWVKFRIDLEHPLAWHLVQELGHVLNYLSIEERLPTIFKPVSPPPYINGGPQEFLSWVIECPASMPPSTVTQWLEGRLPRPVDDLAQWHSEDH